MKSNEVRFAILKNLSLGPGHGYDLYTVLKDEFEIKHPSELYKILRAMKEEGVVRVASVAVSGGREREILELSPAGFEAYYQGLLKASKNFLDLISETMVRKLGEGIVRRLKEMNMQPIFDETENIFVSLAIPIERQLQIINQVSRYFKKGPEIYIKPVKDRRNETELLKTSPKIHFLDDRLAIKPGSIDLVILFGPILKPMFDEASIDNVVSVLKPGGSLLAATLQENLRNITPGLLNGLTNVFSDLFDEPVAKKLVDSLSKLLMSELFYNSFVPDKDIKQFLDKYFEDITPLTPSKTRLAPFFDAFIARKRAT
nr:PadR family transcriptional regulator [Candidatus Sigynarchaeota archaeon]